MLGKCIESSAISLGCGSFSTLKKEEAAILIKAALDSGIYHFDNSDVYGNGMSQVIFSQAVTHAGISRDDIIIQTKCGVKDGYLDLSKEHILKSLENSLKSLNTDYADILLLHRPDALVEPEEVAEAFRVLHSSGKVRYFGVSNHSAAQTELLRKYVEQPLIVNQLQLSLAHTCLIDAGLNTNNNNDAAIDRDGATLDYCRLNDITIQAWSPLKFGFLEGVFLEHEKYKTLNTKINEISKIYNVEPAVIALAWLLRHPAKFQPVIGTTQSERVKIISKACDVELSREEWYSLYVSAGNKII